MSTVRSKFNLIFVTNTNKFHHTPKTTASDILKSRNLGVGEYHEKSTQRAYTYSNIHQRVKGGNSTERICLRPENIEDDGKFHNKDLYLGITVWQSRIKDSE